MDKLALSNGPSAVSKTVSSVRFPVSRSQPVVSRRETSLAADKLFGRYKPEPTHKVREQEVVGNRQEAIRRTREMLRSMTAEQLLQVIEFHPNLDFFEALAFAKREGKLIVPNDIHDKILTEIEDIKLLERLYGSWKWTGTLVIYEEPEKKFGKKVTFTFTSENEVYFISFKIPKQFRGKRNCALVMDHPDFEILEISKKPSMWSRIFDRNKLKRNNEYEVKPVEDATIHLIENFPKRDDWYNPHPETKIPQGEPVEKSEKARHSLRLGWSYVGLLLRGCDEFYFDGRRKGIDLYLQPSRYFGAAFVSLGFSVSDCPAGQFSNFLLKAKNGPQIESSICRSRTLSSSRSSPETQNPQLKTNE